MAFQTLQHKLSVLVDEARAGKIQLPDFQRGYVWDDERVRQLLVTIGVGHPLGVILLLETGSIEIHFQSKPLEGTTPPADGEPERLVLDGQQRLTSLTQALSGDGVVTTSDAGSRRYFIKVAEALKDPSNLFDAITSLPASGKRLTNFNKTVELDVSTRDLEIEEGYFPLSLTFSDEGTAWVLDWGAQTGDMGAVKTFINHILSPMKAYTVPAIELDKTTSMDAVTTVFEKVNQGGVKLTVFELLTAKFAGDKNYFATHKSAFRLREDWEQTREKLDDFDVLSKFENDDFLQAVTLAATYAGPKMTTARKEDVLRLTLDDYLVWAPQVREALLWTAGFLDGQRIHVADDLPYAKQVVPLAVLRVIMGKETDTYGVHGKIRQWFWCGVLGELYGSAIETRFARDVEQVPAWSRGESEAKPPKTVEDAFFNESRLLTLRRRNSAAYKGIYALMLARGVKDWVYNQDFDKKHYLNLKVDIHHVFPRAWCAKNSVPYAEQESIVNKTPLAKTTNIKLSGNAPSVYRGTIRTGTKIPDDEINEIVAGHLIDPDLLWADDFQKFFADRRERLCKLVEHAMGKPVARDILAIDDQGHVELEAEFDGTE